MYKTGIRQVTKDLAKFTDGMSYAVCHNPHPFDKCPILLNILFLKKNFITYCLQMNRTQKHMVASIHSIDATQGVDNLNVDANNNEDDDDDDDDDDSLGTTIDNDAEFQEQKE